MLEVRRLRMLHELHQRETVGAVAAALHQSPSSVSQGLAQLEREVGTPLVRRAGRRLELTPQGVVLAEHAGRILAQLAAAEAAVHSLDGEVTGLVRVAAFQSAALALMPRVLAHLAQHHPRLRVTMTQREPVAAVRALHTRDVDLVVAEEYPGAPNDLPPSADRLDLTPDPLALVVPRRGEPWDAVTGLSDARGVPWVLEPPGSASRAFARRSCHAAGFEPDVRFDVDDLETQLALVEVGQAVTVLPGLMLRARERDVRVVPLPDAPHRRLYTVARRATARTPALTECRRALALVAAG